MSYSEKEFPRIVIKNGRVIDPASNFDSSADVLIERGKIEAVGELSDRRGDIELDAEGLIVTPGLIDMHVHLREPGDEEEETIASGAEAAVAGGFTSIVCMPNTDPPLDNEAAIEFVCRQASRANLSNVLPVGAITKGREGCELAEMAQMVRAGAVAFSDDGCGVASAAVMHKAMQYVKMLDRPILQHCEEPTLAGGDMTAGYVCTSLGLRGIPQIAEDLMVQRDLVLANATGARYHVMHISTADSIEMIRQAKKRGLSVTTEVCPHHLLLTDEACRGYDPNFKVNPPLRGQNDVEACLRGIGDGTIDCLVTDHAPHKNEEKQLEFSNAPFGMIGMECALGLFVAALVEPDILSWPEMIARMTSRPAAVLGVDKGSLSVGADGDITIIEPHQRWIVDSHKFRSRSRNCPFDGMEAVSKAVCTIVGGQIKYEDGIIKSG
jgi:dihydroorotase